jgi:hypothetical protein
MSTTPRVALTQVPSSIQIKPASREITNITEATVVLVLSRSWLGRTKVADNSKVQFKADPKMVSISKKLYNCKELQAIFAHDAKIDSYIKLMCLPHLFRRGISLLPAGLIMQLDEALKAHVVERNRLVDIFVNVYDDVVKKSEEQLKPASEGGLFNPADYPAKEKVREFFSFEWNYMEFGPSAKLKDINKALYESEAEKSKEQWKEYSKVVIALLRKQALALVDHMVELVTPAEEGKRKVFRKNSFKKISEFLAVFDEKNLANDAELKVQVEKMRSLLNGVSPSALKDEAIRTSFETGFASIKSEMSQLVTEAPSRSFRFGNKEVVPLEGISEETEDETEEAESVTVN